MSPLGSLCDLITKGTTPTSIGRTFTNAGVVFLKAESIGESGRPVSEKVAYIDDCTHRLLRRSQLAVGDLLISIAGVLGRVGFVEECDLPANTNQALALVRLSNPSRLQRNLLFYFLRSPVVEKQIRNINVQAAQANISLKNVRDFIVPIPHRESEQRAIATALSDVDALLDALDRLIAKKRDLKQAAMQQLLTGKTRLPGYNGKWAVKRLGDVGVFSKGRGIRKDEVVADGLPCVRYGEIYTHHNDHVRAFNSFITPETAKQSQRLEQGDLLFAVSGETCEEIGKCVAFLWDLEAYAGGDIVIFRSIGQSPEFMGYLLNHSSVASQKARLGQGDLVVHISARNLARLELHLPRFDEQSAIAAVLSDMDAELTALTQRRDKTRALKQGMMQELLTGRTRLV